jgi:glycosyltransferase involved in cell wall biosynthesis
MLSLYDSGLRKDTPLQPSLSLILPVFNAERTLAPQLLHLLEIAGEISPQFEVLVIDDGSSDHTCDIADELAREYPQIRVIRHGQPRGMEGITESCYAKAKGDVLMLLTPGEAIQLPELKRLWQASQNSEMKSINAADAMRTPPALRPLSKALLGRLTQWGTAVTAKSDLPKSVRLLPREATNRMNQPNRPANFLAHLRNLAIGE